MEGSEASTDDARTTRSEGRVGNKILGVGFGGFFPSLLTLACRFGDSEKAGKFKAAFEDAQKHMEKELAGEDTADTTAGDEAADALANLSTKKEGEEEPKKEGGEE